MSKRRVRQHANPLGFRRAVERPDWARVFADPTRPLEVDVGCAKGTFAIERARSASVNVVGLELRAPVVEQARAQAAAAGVANVHFVCCSANASFAELFAPDSLARVYVHFPDPWFKTRHHKRRVLTRELLDVLATRLRSGGELHFATDFAEYAESALALLESHASFKNAHGPGARAPGPTSDVPSDRERLHTARGDPVWRYLYVRI